MKLAILGIDNPIGLLSPRLGIDYIFLNERLLVPNEQSLKYGGSQLTEKSFGQLFE